jgi:hypothetical protein
MPVTMESAITIRQATEEDRPAVWRLAALDDRRAPRGEALLAFVDGELRAAVGLDGRRAVADPFHRTDRLVRLLHVAAR